MRVSVRTGRIIPKPVVERRDGIVPHQWKGGRISFGFLWSVVFNPVFKLNDLYLPTHCYVVLELCVIQLNYFSRPVLGGGGYGA